MVAAALALARLVVMGAVPAGWDSLSVAAPLVAGWVVLAIVGAATHLVPAIGPGDQARHRRQREILGQGATLRLALLDGGVALLAVGLPLGSTPGTVAGVLIGGAGLALSLGLLGGAVLSRGSDLDPDPQTGAGAVAAGDQARQARR